MDEVQQLAHAQQQERKRDEQQLEGQLAFMTENDTAKQKLQMKKDTVLKKLEKHEGMGQKMQEQRDIWAGVLAQCLEVRRPSPSPTSPRLASLQFRRTASHCSTATIVPVSRYPKSAAPEPNK